MELEGRRSCSGTGTIAARAALAIGRSTAAAYRREAGRDCTLG